MKSNFSVVCPHCKKFNDFVDDNWHDEFIDDSQSHLTPCLHCGKEIQIEVIAVYNLVASKPEDDDII